MTLRRLFLEEWSTSAGGTFSATGEQSQTLRPEARWAQTTMGVVAIKAKNKEKKELLKPSKVFSEVNSMRMLNHPNIVKLLDVFDTRKLCL